MVNRLSGTTLVVVIAICTILSLGRSVHAVELCGLWSDASSQGSDAPRFRILKEFSGKAFLDMETCLVWEMDVLKEPMTLGDAAYHCANEGQGGPQGKHRGWRVPTLAELLSLDTEQWLAQRDTFAPYKLPPIERTEDPLWTDTPWPSEPGSWGGVTFSARTTIAHPIKQSEKAGVWCVRASRATGLR